jgi:adenine-specific DNA-methyltransferase
MTKTLEEYTKDELIEIIQNLKRRKKFGLVYEHKPEEVVRLCETELPVIEAVDERTIERIKDAKANVIIEGDNYHALSVLNYTHTGKVDVIYVDPPFNTGARDWRYNNHYVDGSDTFRHSKWLSFMEHRLRLSQSLLKNTGIIIVAIDHYELFYLGQLLDELFGESNRLGCITVVNKADGRSDDKYFATANEFLLVYAKNSKFATIGNIDLSEDEIKKKYPKQDDRGRYTEKPLMSQGVDSLRQDRPTLFYPVYYNSKINKLSTEPFDGVIELYPIDINGVERRWGSGKARIQYLIDQDDIVTKKSVRNGSYFLYRKKRADTGTKPKTFWNETRYNAAAHGTKLVDKVVGKSRVFNYPKALYAVMDALQISGSKDALILDFFAGSGTTGHAALELNRKDGGNRQFILCTNNENGIAENVTYPRIRNVVDGYADVSGIPANVRYFKTALVSRRQTDDQTRIELVARSTDMICLREDTFEKVIDTKLFKVFGNANHYAAIVFEPEAIVLLKDALAKLKDNKTIHIYVFSLSNDTYESDFTDLERTHELRPIPESILEVYRRIHKIQNGELGV